MLKLLIPSLLLSLPFHCSQSVFPPVAIEKEREWSVDAFVGGVTVTVTVILTRTIIG